MLRHRDGYLFPLAGLNVPVDFQFAVRLSFLSIAPVRGLQLVMDVVALRISLGGDFEVLHGLRSVAIFEQHLAKLILGLGVAGIRSDQLTKQ